MKIAIYNLEPKYTNIALEKIKMYYESRGHLVEDYFPLNHHNYDKIYCSSIFDFTSKEYVTPDMICGGTGFIDKVTIRLPKEIDKMKPKINCGFCSRGCIRNCKFCLVRQKEGPIKVSGSIYDFWDGSSKNIIILDNNILALPDHFKKTCDDIRLNNLRVDFNQGLDIRLLTDGICRILKSIKIKEVRFAFDNDDLFPIIKKKMKLLKKYKIYANFYVLVGFDSTFDNELKRINYLHSNGQRAYIMRYKTCKGNKKYMALAHWCNSPTGFRIMDFYNEYLNTDYAKDRYKKYFKKELTLK
jgi:radical SAM superfamily enzyme YgiQ (UPF0313 family)